MKFYCRHFYSYFVLYICKYLQLYNFNTRNFINKFRTHNSSKIYLFNWFILEFTLKNVLLKEVVTIEK